jgi:hypothetical protein
MQKARDDSNSYVTSLASNYATAPKYERHSNFSRSSPRKDDPTHQHGYHRKGMGYDRLNFRLRVFAPEGTEKIRAARKRYETTGERDIRISRAVAKAHKARMAQLLWYIHEVCPIEGPKAKLP